MLLNVISVQCHFNGNNEIFIGTPVEIREKSGAHIQKNQLSNIVEEVVCPLFMLQKEIYLLENNATFQSHRIFIRH